jgi:hypothetical protein
MNLDMAANKVAEKLVEENVDRVVSFDPAMIMLIIQAIKLLIENCNLFKNPAKLKEAAKKPSILQKFFVKQYVKKAMDDDDMDRAYSKQVVSALCKAGADATVDELADLVRPIIGEVNSADAN